MCKNLVLYLKRAYIPVVSLLLITVLSIWITKSGSVDPLTAAQNQRIHFQEAPDPSLSTKLINNGLTKTEICLAAAVLNKKSKTTHGQLNLFYIGNSQTQAIMDSNPGDLIAPQWLQIFLARQYTSTPTSVEVTLGSLPNLTITELLIKSVDFIQSKPNQPKIILFSAVLEGFRGLGARDAVAELTDHKQTKTQLAKLALISPDLPAAQTALAPFINSNNTPSPSNTNRQFNQSLANKFEQRLQILIEKIPLFASRQGLISQFYLFYYALRNKILGVTTTTTRPVPSAPYQASLQLLELLLRYAKSNDVRLIIYIAPVRPIKPNPFLPEDIERFRKDVAKLCYNYHEVFLDYTNLIPNVLWTNYPEKDIAGLEGQKDFAHFTGAAHQLLAKQLTKDILPIISNSLKEGCRP